MLALLRHPKVEIAHPAFELRRLVGVEGREVLPERVLELREGGMGDTLVAERGLHAFEPGL